MGSPKPPEPPAPEETAQAQTGTNVGTAIANTMMRNVNTYGPNGSLEYQQRGSYNWTDPYTNQTYSIPQFSAYQQLSPQAEAVNQSNLSAQGNLAQTAAQQSGFLRDYLANRDNSPTAPQFQGVQGSPRNSTVGGAALPKYGNVNSVPQYSTMGSAPALQNVQGGTQYSRMGSPEPIQLIDSALPQSFQGSAPELGRVSNSAEYTNVTGPEAYQTNIADSGDITRTYGTDFSEDRRRVEDALMSRLNPQIDRDRQALETQLANQGLTSGTEAYDREIERFSRNSTDARLSAILAGGQEQSRLADLEARRAGFENAAQAQSFGQNVTRAGFGNDARRANFADNLTTTQANNAIQSQGLQDNLATTGFNNQAARDIFGMDLQANQFNNDMRLRQREAGVQAAAFNNGARSQQFNDSLAANQFNNAATQREFQDGMSAAAFNNGNAQARYGMDLQTNQFNNNVQQQGLRDNLSVAGFNNAAAGQRMQDILGLSAFNNDARNQTWQQNTAATQANNSLRTQAMQNQIAMRNQPINEITALLGGSQVAMPNYQMNQPSGIATTDVAGLIGQNYQQQYGNYQQRAASRNQLMGGLFGLGANIIAPGAGGLFGMG